MVDRDTIRRERRVQRILWWERNKDKVIAYTIMTSMIVFFIWYLIYAYLQGWNLRFN